MANIRINDVPQRIQYVVSSPTQSSFPIPFPFLADTDIVVWQDEVQLVRGGSPGQYSLSGAGTASGGTMTLVTAAVTDVVITITGETPIDRTSIYSPTISNLTGDDLNSDLNRIIIMLQELWTVQNYMMLQYKPWLELSQDITVTKDRYLPILPPLYGWMMNEANTEIVAAPFGGGGGGGGDTFITNIFQDTHNFNAGQVVFFNGVEYELAIATSAADAEVIGLVESVVDASNFNLMFGGLTQALTGATPGGVYFLSDSVLGGLTLTEPTNAGYISKPLVIATSPTEGFFYNFRGKILNSPEFAWAAIAVNTALSANQNYYTTGGGTLALALPSSCSAGSIIRVKGYASSGWRITQATGQSIVFGNVTSTPGVGGYIQSQLPSDDIELLCVVDNLTFTVLGCPVGTLTVI